VALGKFGKNDWFAGFLSTLTGTSPSPKSAATFIAAATLTDTTGTPIGTTANPFVVGSASGGDAVTIANGADVAQGSTTDARYTDTTGAAAGTVISFLKALAKSALNALVPGQAVMASSAPVTIASDQSAVKTAPQAIASGGASFLNIVAGQATTTVKSGAGTLYSISLNSAATATNTTTIYDNTAASGTIIGKPAATTATVPTTLTYGPAGLAFSTGLTIITATANGSDMTIVYK
jgi:hypothetical protein